MKKRPRLEDDFAFRHSGPPLAGCESILSSRPKFLDAAQDSILACFIAVHCSAAKTAATWPRSCQAVSVRGPRPPRALQQQVSSKRAFHGKAPPPPPQEAPHVWSVELCNYQQACCRTTCFIVSQLCAQHLRVIWLEGGAARKPARGSIGFFEGMEGLNNGDTAWMAMSCALVLFMTPGLAFFYGGLVRDSNIVNTMMMCLVTCGRASEPAQSRKSQ